MVAILPTMQVYLAPNVKLFAQYKDTSLNRELCTLTAQKSASLIKKIRFEVIETVSPFGM